MKSENDLYIRRLKDHGISRTKPRKAVFDALLASNHRPMSTIELVQECAKNADRASVYRSIEALEKAGILKRVYHGWKYKIELSDEFHGHHHHMTCVICGNVHATHNDARLEKIISEMATSCGYKITEHHVEIRGICSSCSG